MKKIGVVKLFCDRCKKEVTAFYTSGVGKYCKNCCAEVSLEKEENLVNLEVENDNLLKKPYGAYLNSGPIGEKIFEQYCKQKGYRFTRPLSFMWSIYGVHLARKYGSLSADAQQRVQKYGCDEVLPVLSKKQINFLIKEFIEQKNTNFDITGFPDYIIWREQSILMAEIKSRTSFLSKTQERVFDRLKTCFDIKVYNVNFDVEVRKIVISNITLKEI